MKKVISAATRHLGYKELWPLQRGDSGAVPSRERRICFPSNGFWEVTCKSKERCVMFLWFLGSMHTKLL